jgi:two-component system, OmpR family, response regulator RegX3
MSENSITVLVVEDEESFVDALLVGLRREGFEVFAARDGLTALELFDQVSPDIVLLDVMLPKLSGIDVCRAIRLKSSTPVIMVTAKTSEIDTVVGLEVGADDYIAKPYRLREVVARIRAVLRRPPITPSGPSPTPVDPPANGERKVVEVGDVRLDITSHELWVRGELVSLPLKEFELLALLLENAGRVLTREVLIERVWGFDYEGDTKTLDVHVKRLRGKIEVNPGIPTRILTVRGLGYKYHRGDKR